MTTDYCDEKNVTYIYYPKFFAFLCLSFQHRNIKICIIIEERYFSFSFDKTDCQINKSNFTIWDWKLTSGLPDRRRRTEKVANAWNTLVLALREQLRLAPEVRLAED